MKREPYNASDEKLIEERIYRTKIDGLYFVEHSVFDDQRGYYAELSVIPDIEKVIGKRFEVKQINMAQSKTNVVRGMHAEDWNKLVTVFGGRVFCALADVRPDSDTYKQVEIFLLGEDEDCVKGSIFINKGIANSLCVQRGPIDYLYCVDELYRERDKRNDQAISVFDPVFEIEWPIERDVMILSERDRASVNLNELV